MQAEVIRMNENSWRIEDNGVRFFLLTGTERALLIDTGKGGVTMQFLIKKIETK